MRVFITGATGYVGSAVCAAVKRRGHDVVGLARNQAAVEKLKALGVHPVAGSLGDRDILREMTHDADAVIHCAFEPSPQGAELDATALDAMLAAIHADHEAFIYTSGVWVYGDTGGEEIDESAPLNPIPLVAWRPSHERKVQDAQKHKLRTIVIRPGLVYGGHGGLVGMMREQAKSHQLSVVGNGDNHWATIHLDALAELYAFALEEAPSDSMYNAVNDDSPTYGEIARAVNRAVKGGENLPTLSLERAREIMGPFADALALDQHVSAAKAKRELHWDSREMTILETLATTAAVT
jgi:nucleoside-diphosphate-sugar epimerase